MESLKYVGKSSRKQMPKKVFFQEKQCLKLNIKYEHFLQPCNLLASK